MNTRIWRPKSLLASRILLTWLPLLALLLAVGWPTAGRAEDEEPEPPPPVGVTTVPAAQGEKLEAVVPGTLVAYTFPRRAGGERYALLLVAPEEQPKTRILYHLAFGSEPRLEPISARVPDTADALLAVAPAEDAAQQVLLGAEGAVFRVEGLDGLATGGAELRLAPVVQGLHLRHQLRRPEPGYQLPEPDLVWATAGQLRPYRWTEAGALEALAPRSLPVRAERQRSGLMLTSPRVTPVITPEGRVVYAVGPEEHGAVRLRSLLLDPDAGEEDTEAEAWCQLPEPETLELARFDHLNGQPVLIVTAYSSEKIGIFARQRLRVFRLRPDRSRAGTRPMLESLTASRRWQEAEPVVTDVDGDGFEDLVVLQAEGLTGGELIVEAFMHNGRSRFHNQTRKVEVKVPASRWHYGSDLTGDGRPDLLSAAEGVLKVFPGNGHRKKRGVVEKKPLWELPLAEEEGGTSLSIEIGSDGADGETRIASDFGSPRLLDLDADGRPEVFLVARSLNGRGALRVVTLPPG